MGWNPSKPYAETCSNQRENYWTCPGCYTDLPTRTEGVFTCSSCQRKVECEIEYQPVSRATLVLEGDDAE